MVEPIYLIVIALATAFLLGLLRKAGAMAPIAVTLLALGAMTVISGQWAYGIVFGGVEPLHISTAGLQPPFSINLLMGASEAVLTLIINVSTLLSGLFLVRLFKERPVYAPMLLLVFAMGLNGVILTRDLFNLFVFIEIVSIASAGLIALNGDIKQLGAGFKYILAGAFASGMMLLGIIFTYYTTGSLNIDVIGEMMNPALASTGFVGLFLVFIGVMIELKPFPVNGWGLDAYEASTPAVSALLAAGTVTASFYAFAKIMAVTGAQCLDAAIVIGAISFIGSNIVALKQDGAARLLGYSSIAQAGLLVLTYSLMKKLALPNVEFVMFGLLVTHAFAKAGLFWLTGIVSSKDVKDWGVIRKSPLALTSMIVCIFALVGFPPFPSFFAKWDLIMAIATKGGFSLTAVILVGSMIEAIYLFRWLGYALKRDGDEKESLDTLMIKLIPTALSAVILLTLGYVVGNMNNISYIPLLVVLGFGVIDSLDSKIKNSLALLVVGCYTYIIFPTFMGDLFKMSFGAIFMGGALLTLFSGYYYNGRRRGFYPSALSMFFGLFMLIQADTMLQFFYGWEFMAIGSYFLLIRGKKSEPHGYSYLMFSIGGSLAMLAGFSMAYVSAGTGDLAALHHITVYPTLAYSLMLIGFMTKTATLGFHIWLPGAHGEAVADIHFMASAILLKAGVFGIILVLLGMDLTSGYAKNILFTLGWLGVLSALVANANAAFQESAKRLLAWSSIGQLGYIVFGLATMSHLGWLIALSMSITHFLYKGILFLVIGGVSLKLGTPMMYKMGGLIRRMPYSFFAVLVAIITLSGVPPLVGYTGKWLIYNVSITNGLYLQGAVISVSGIIAFLYLFRLIYSMFLGQLKDEHRRIKEISIWFLIPVYMLFSYIMYVSFFPHTLLRPIGEMLMAYFPDNPVIWAGSYGRTSMGYFNGTLIMYVFMALFALTFAILLFINRTSQGVKQFNIVYAAERPARPETTHFSYNFFAPYRRAVGFLEYPFTTNFWNRTADVLYSVAGFTRRIYTGNGQTYLLQLVMFVVMTFLLISGGK